MNAEPLVLLVDEDCDSRLMYSRILFDYGIIAITADGGEQGVRLTVALRPEVVLFDTTLPSLDLAGIFAQIRAQPGSRPPKFVAIADRASAETRQDLRRAGFDDVVFKPIEARRLAESVLSMLRGRRVLIGES